MIDDLTDRQRAILEYMIKFVREKGYPPSVREIGKEVGLSSSSSVHNHLSQLEEKGYVHRDPSKPRAIEITHKAMDVRPVKEVVNVPLVGQVTAGQPILAEENVSDYFPVPADFVGSGDLFMLRIRGESMIGAGIFDGDYVIVRRQDSAMNGEIVVALLGDEATVKRLYKEKDHVRLQPENEHMDPIVTTDVSILGKVVGLVRRIH